MFESAKLKIERAKHHIADVDASFTSFIQTHPHRLAMVVNPETGRMDIKVRLNHELPKSIALTVGDAIHNMRTALDHMTWEVVGRDKGTQDRWLKLPAGDNRVNYEATCQGIKTPSQS